MVLVIVSFILALIGLQAIGFLLSGDPKLHKFVNKVTIIFAIAFSLLLIVHLIVIGEVDVAIAFLFLLLFVVLFLVIKHYLLP